MVEKEKRNILKASSIGVGELIIEALNHHCKNIYISLGGSSTNDAGFGLATALGVKFLDENMQELIPTPDNLLYIHSIDTSHIDARIKDTNIIVLCDVDTPFIGKNGSTYTYGPQKGGNAVQLDFLENSFKHLIRILNEHRVYTNENLPGSGAAGGIGFMLNSIFNAKLLSGIDTILDILNAHEKLKGIDIVFTGEGRVDYQTVCGKVPVGIAKLASKKGIPTVAVAGYLGQGANKVFEHSISAFESCIYAPSTVGEAILNAKENASFAAERLIRAILVGLKL